MTRTLCFDTTEALHDRRFRRKLTKYEGMDFVFLLGFAGLECRDPAFIPAGKREDLALDMGWTGKLGREQMAKRLARWSAPGIELIEIQEDGGIQINYLLDREYEQEERQLLPAHPANGTGTNGSSTNGNGTSATGAERRSEAERRQQNRRYSGNSAAERSRKSYWERKQKEAGSEFFPVRELENLTDETENLTLITSKPHGSSEEIGQNLTENHTESHTENHTEKREVSRARVGDVTDVVGGFKDSLSSGDVSNVARGENLTQNLTQNLTSQNPTKPHSEKVISEKAPSGEKVPSGSRPSAPPPRPPLLPQQVPQARHADVQEVLKAVGDDPEIWTKQWTALWRHCHQADNLACWDRAFVLFVWRQRVSPVRGAGSIGKNGPWLRGAILEMLLAAGKPYVPVGQSQAAADPVDPAKAAEIHEEVLAIKAAWDAEETERLSGITPLGDIQAEPGTEDEG